VGETFQNINSDQEQSSKLEDLPKAQDSQKGLSLAYLKLPKIGECGPDHLAKEDQVFPLKLSVVELPDPEERALANVIWAEARAEPPASWVTKLFKEHNRKLPETGDLGIVTLSRAYKLASILRYKIDPNAVQKEFGISFNSTQMSNVEHFFAAADTSGRYSMFGAGVGIVAWDGIVSPVKGIFQALKNREPTKVVDVLKHDLGQLIGPDTRGMVFGQKVLNKYVAALLTGKSRG